MTNSKLIELLKSLHPSEFRQFNKFIRATFYTNSPLVIKLHDYLRKHYPNFDSPKLKREVVYRHLFPKSPFSAAKLRDVNFKITKILENYLLHVELQQNETQKKRLLSQIYRRRNLNVIFDKNIQESIAILDAQPNRGADYFFDKYWLQKEYYIQKAALVEGGEIGFLKEALTNLSHFYAIERLRLGLDLVNRSTVYNEQHHFEHEVIPQDLPQDNYLFKLLSLSIQLLKTNDSTIFFQVKEQLAEHIAHIHQKDALRLLPLLLNYTFQQMTIDEERFLPESFELYKLGLTKDIFIYDNHFLEFPFFNMVTIGAKLQKFAWVRSFLEQYGPMLRPTVQADILTLSNAYLSFFNADYAVVINLLQDNRIKKPTLALNAKGLLLRTYYHLYQQDATYYQLVLSNCLAFTKYLQRESSVSQRKKNAYLNFTKILKKILMNKQKQKNISIDEVNDLVNSYSNVFAKNWLRTITII